MRWMGSIVRDQPAAFGLREMALPPGIAVEPSEMAWVSLRGPLLRGWLSRVYRAHSAENAARSAEISCTTGHTLCLATGVRSWCLVDASGHAARASRGAAGAYAPISTV